MAIVIDNDLNTFVDGVNFGQPADVIANNLALAPGVNVAMRSLIDGLRAESTAALSAKDTEKATAIAEKDAALATKDAEKAAVVAERDAAHGALAEVKSLAATAEDPELKAALEAKADDGRKSAEDKKKAALAAEIAAKQAELDELNAK